jgi:hypothetical protein
MSTLPSATTTPWTVPLLRLNTRVVRRRVGGGTECKTRPIASSPVTADAEPVSREAKARALVHHDHS